VAGDARFAAHARHLGERLADDDRAAGSGAGSVAAAEADTPRWSAAGRVLFVAVAEGLAYGREREPLRRAGEWLAAGGAPDALTRELPRLPALDAIRLEGLMVLRARWADAGPWAALRPILAGPGEPAALARALAEALRVPGGAVSSGRADILLANVVLPFAAAWAERVGDADLGARARAIFASLGGLPPNQITRAMGRQLGLPRRPPGARAQQGLHHLWASWCREKRCDGCPCGHDVARASCAQGNLSICWHGDGSADMSREAMHHVRARSL
jgi:hypothetical protein